VRNKTLKMFLENEDIQVLQNQMDDSMRNLRFKLKEAIFVTLESSNNLKKQE
ncbi:hypothetical protein THOM_1596, partial [Trachipleistophora hominis]